MAYTNNLPLALVPIRHNPKAEGSKMTLMFWTTLFFPRILHIFASPLSTISQMRWNIQSMCLDLWCD